MFSKTHLLLLLGVLATGVYVGCSDVEFEAAPFDPTVYERSTYCEQVGDIVRCTGEKSAGMVDILFVDDNSGSMYEEQTKMATKFPTFIDSISNLDFQIGIITTDISASPNNPPDEANQFGALQDGQLVPFPNGAKVISNSTANAAGEFSHTIQRPETYNCDQSYSSCPSGDERGIYALNMAFDRADSALFRPDAHLAVVILSDEDERSNGGNIAGYPLEAYDMPETLVQKFGSVFGPDKTLSVHAVVIKPGDTSCYNTQNAQEGVKGFYANTYKNLASPSSALKGMGNIINGHMGSICSSDYGVELGSISDKLQDNVNRIPLFCKPILDSVQVHFSPAPPVQIEFFVNGENQLVLEPAAPAGTKVSYTYDCTLADARK